MKRTHYEKAEKIIDLWNDEKSSLKKLPEYEFEVFRLESALVNNYGEIKVDKLNITVFGTKPGQSLPVKITWDEVIVMDSEYNILTVMPRPYVNKVHVLPWTEIFKGYLRKPRSTTHSQFIKMLPAKLREYITVEDLSLRKERLSACANWISVYSINELNEVISNIKGIESIDVITAALHETNANVSEYKRSFEDNYTPPELKQLSSNLSKYNILGKVGV